MARNVNDGFEGLPDLDNNIVHFDSKHPIQRGDNSSSSSRLSFSILKSGLGLILFVLFFVAFFRISAGLEPLTFTSLIEGFQSMPNIVFTGFTDLTIDSDWGVFNFFRNFLNIFAGTLGVLIYIASLIGEVILTVVWLVRWLFLLG